MTDPVTAIIIMSAIGVGAQAYAAHEEGKAAEQQAKASAAWNDYNAKIAKREAEAERKAAEFESRRHERQAKILLARGRAIRGAAGVTEAGSPLLVAEDTAAQLALEGANIRITGERRVARWRGQSILDSAKAGAARTAAAGYRRAGTLQAGAGLLGGMAQVGFMGYQMRK